MVDDEANREYDEEQAAYEQMRDDLDNALSSAEDAEAWAIEQGGKSAVLLADATRALRAAIASFEPPDDGPEILGRAGGMWHYA
jgi:hypothetical protein